MKLHVSYHLNAEPGTCQAKGKPEHLIALGDPVMVIFLFDRGAAGARIGDGRYPGLRLCRSCAAPALEAMQIWFPDDAALRREGLEVKLPLGQHTVIVGLTAEEIRIASGKDKGEQPEASKGVDLTAAVIADLTAREILLIAGNHEVAGVAQWPASIIKDAARLVREAILDASKLGTATIHSDKRVTGIWISDPGITKPSPVAERRDWVFGPIGARVIGKGGKIKMDCCGYELPLDQETFPLVDTPCPCGRPRSYVVKWGPFVGGR